MMTTIRITVIPRDPGTELHELDDNVAGEYCYEIDPEEVALDRFHSTVPIKVLDDFIIETEVVG